MKNNTTSAINLNGWVPRSLTDNSPSIILTGTIAPSGYYLLERTDDNTVSGIPADQAPYTGDLGNGGESLQLTDALSNVIDTANGNGGAWPSGSGSPGYYSMERIASLAPDADLNWAMNDGVTRNGLDASGDPLNGTPRQPNSARSYIPTAPGRVLISAVAREKTGLVRTPRSSVRPAPARRRSSSSWPGSATRRAAASWSAASTFATSTCDQRYCRARSRIR